MVFQCSWVFVLHTHTHTHMWHWRLLVCGRYNASTCNIPSQLAFVYIINKLTTLPAQVYTHSQQMASGKFRERRSERRSFPIKKELPSKNMRFCVRFLAFQSFLAFSILCWCDASPVHPIISVLLAAGSPFRPVCGVSSSCILAHTLLSSFRPYQSMASRYTISILFSSVFDLFCVGLLSDTYPHAHTHMHTDIIL